MAAPIEHRCTSCGTLCGTVKNVLLPIGRPFSECPKCKGFVERLPYVEWSSLHPGARLRLLGGGLLIASAGAAIPALAYSVVRRDAPTETLLALGLVFLALGLSGFGMFLSNAIQRSKKRMADPMYRARLAEFEMSQIQSKSS